MIFPRLICLFPWLPFSHGFRYGYDGVSQHARQSQTRKLPQPWEEAIPWLFHDFLGNFHIPRLFHDFPWQQFFPGFSMTVGTLIHFKTTEYAEFIIMHVVRVWRKLDDHWPYLVNATRYDKTTRDPHLLNSDRRYAHAEEFTLVHNDGQDAVLKEPDTHTTCSGRDTGVTPKKVGGGIVETNSARYGLFQTREGPSKFFSEMRMKSWALSFLKGNWVNNTNILIVVCLGRGICGW